MSDEKVIQWPGITRHNLDPDQILENLNGKLNEFVIAGYDKEGNEFFAGTIADGAECLWLLERMKKCLLEMPDVIEDD